MARATATMRLEGRWFQVYRQRSMRCPYTRRSSSSSSSSLSSPLLVQLAPLQGSAPRRQLTSLRCLYTRVSSSSPSTLPAVQLALESFPYTRKSSLTSSSLFAVQLALGGSSPRPSPPPTVAAAPACLSPPPVTASASWRMCHNSRSSASLHVFKCLSQRKRTMVTFRPKYLVLPAILCCRRPWQPAAALLPVQPPSGSALWNGDPPVTERSFAFTTNGEQHRESVLDGTSVDGNSVFGPAPAAAGVSFLGRGAAGPSKPSRSYGTARRHPTTTSWSGCSTLTQEKADALVAAALDLLSRSLEQEIEDKRQRLKVLRQQHGKHKIGDVTVQHVVGGMRGLTALLTETSLLDAQQGITYRGFTIKELVVKLPRFGREEYPPVEGAIWLLLTGRIPSRDEARALGAALNALSCFSPPPREGQTAREAAADEAATATTSHFISHFTGDALDALPPTVHPMTQLVTAVATLQPSSRLAAAYQAGMRKDQLWQPALYDALSAIAKTAVLGAAIYQRSFHPDMEPPPPRMDLDWGANFARLLGLRGEEAHNLIRLYLLLHADHEGGNVSAHTAHVVGSALSDIFLSTAAGLAGLAGPLHGLANQEALNWLQEALKDLQGREPTPERIRAIAEKTLQSGRVIPGYGHAVLRSTDPRFTLQREFALKYLKGDKLFELLDVAHRVIPEVLLATGKVQNPYPNVDCHSGVLLHHYGLTEPRYYTVLFGVARTIGIAAQHVVSRGLMLPIERPKSTTVAQLEATVKGPVTATV